MSDMVSIIPVREIFVWSLKMVFPSVHGLFLPAVERIKTSLARFPAKNNPNMEINTLSALIVSFD